MDGVRLPSLRGFVRVRRDESVRVIVFESTDPQCSSARTGTWVTLTESDALSGTTQAAIAAAEDEPVPDGMNILQGRCR